MKKIYSKFLFVLIFINSFSITNAAAGNITLIPEASQRPVYSSWFNLDKNTDNNTVEYVLKTIFNRIYDNFLVIVAGAVILYIIYGGILYITSGGSPEKAKKGRQIIINTMIGLIVILTSYTILQVIINIARVIGGTAT